MAQYEKTYETPFGEYAIHSNGPYKAREPIDNTPIAPDSLSNHGRFDVLHDGAFLVKCKTLAEAQKTLCDILKYAHRYKLEP